MVDSIICSVTVLKCSSVKVSHCIVTVLHKLKQRGHFVVVLDSCCLVPHLVKEGQRIFNLCCARLYNMQLCIWCAHAHSTQLHASLPFVLFIVCTQTKFYLKSVCTMCNTHKCKSLEQGINNTIMLQTGTTRTHSSKFF